MRTTLCFSALLAAIVLGGCTAKSMAHQVAVVSPPPMLIDSRGVTMPLERVVRQLAYRPYVPRVRVLEFAVIPPIGGTDTPGRRGIAIEYAAGKHAMLLSEWPSRRFPVTFGGVNVVVQPCTAERFDTSSVAWSSRRGLIMTLQPDGALPAGTVAVEAHRLMASGACS